MTKAIALVAALFVVGAVGVFGVLGGFDPVGASGDDGVVVRKPVIVDKSALAQPAPAEVIKPMGDPFPDVAESSVAIRNATPLELIQGVIDARARKDDAYLARTLESTAHKAKITVEDTNVSWRQYTSELIAPLWTKIEAAFAANEYSIAEDGDKAMFVPRLGGNLGEVQIALIRINGKWYFQGT